MKREVSAISFGLALAAFSMSNASAEEKCKMSSNVAAANTTYTQQHVIDVGDVPGHQVRIFNYTERILQTPSQTARGSGPRKFGARMTRIVRCRANCSRSGSEPPCPARRAISRPVDRTSARLGAPAGSRRAAARRLAFPAGPLEAHAAAQFRPVRRIRGEARKKSTFLGVSTTASIWSSIAAPSP
jgi:hypothetical protein